jgi:hypothetical protein
MLPQRVASTMRKIVTSQISASELASRSEWLDLTGISRIEVTSEDYSRPVEAALILGLSERGWRAAQPGVQTLRLVFDEPVSVRRALLQFDERLHERTQEFTLTCLSDEEPHWQEIVRQQYRFNPPGTVREIEDYHFELKPLRAIELRIVPDVSDAKARASLTAWRLASGAT